MLHCTTPTTGPSRRWSAKDTEALAETLEEYYSEDRAALCNRKLDSGFEWHAIARIVCTSTNKQWSARLLAAAKRQAFEEGSTQPARRDHVDDDRNEVIEAEDGKISEDEAEEGESDEPETSESSSGDEDEEDEEANGDRSFWNHEELNQLRKMLRAGRTDWDVMGASIGKGRSGTATKQIWRKLSKRNLLKVDTRQVKVTSWQVWSKPVEVTADAPVQWKKHFCIDAAILERWKGSSRRRVCPQVDEMRADASLQVPKKREHILKCCMNGESGAAISIMGCHLSLVWPVSSLRLISVPAACLLTAEQATFSGFRWKWAPGSPAAEALRKQMINANAVEEEDESAEKVADDEQDKREDDESEDGGSEEDESDDDDADDDDALDPIFAASLGIGTSVQAKDAAFKQWYEAVVIETNAQTDQVKVHFRGWRTRFDTWYKRSSRMLRPSTFKPSSQERKLTGEHQPPNKRIRKEWSDGEVSVLLDLIRREGVGEWDRKAVQMGSNRTPGSLLGKFNLLRQSSPEVQALQDEHDANRQQLIWQREDEEDSSEDDEDAETNTMTATLEQDQNDGGTEPAQAEIDERTRVALSPLEKRRLLSRVKQLQDGGDDGRIYLSDKRIRTLRSNLWQALASEGWTKARRSSACSSLYYFPPGVTKANGYVARATRPQTEGEQVYYTGMGQVMQHLFDNDWHGEALPEGQKGCAKSGQPMDQGRASAESDKTWNQRGDYAGLHYHKKCHDVPFPASQEQLKITMAGSRVFTGETDSWEEEEQATPGNDDEENEGDEDEDEDEPPPAVEEIPQEQHEETPLKRKDSVTVELSPSMQTEQQENSGDQRLSGSGRKTDENGYGEEQLVTPCMAASQFTWASQLERGADYVRTQAEEPQSDEASYRQFVKRLKAELGNTHPDTVTAQMNLAILLKRTTDNVAEARNIHEEVVRIRTEQLGMAHADTLVAKVRAHDTAGSVAFHCP